MLDGLFNSIARFFQVFVFWKTIEPWEQCLRVRLGKHLKRLQPGFHFKIPFFDVLHVQSSRYRNALCFPQTLTTADGHTLVCTFALGYALDNIEKLYQGVYDVNSTLTQTVASFVADEVAKTNRADLSVHIVNKKLTNLLHVEFSQYGLKDVTVKLQDFAFIKAFRLIQDQRWSNDFGLSPSHSGTQ